jgi:hypothetical protein
MKYVFGRTPSMARDWIKQQDFPEKYKVIVWAQDLLGARNSEVHLVADYGYSVEWPELQAFLDERKDCNNLNVIQHDEEDRKENPQ